MIALDTETCLFGPGNMAPPLVCVSVYGHETGADLVHWSGSENWLADVFNFKIVGHNIAYDTAVISAQFPDLLPVIVQAYEEDRITDTMIRQQLIDIASGLPVIKQKYSLAALAKRFLGRDLDKTQWRTGYAELRPLPLEQWPEGARMYAIEDAHTTFDIWETQESFAPYLQDQYRQVRSAFALHLASVWGVETDPVGLRVLSERTQLEISRIENLLHSSGLVRADGSRDTKRAQAMCSEAYRGNPPRTDKGGVALDKTTCANSGNPALKAYGKYTTAKSVLNKDIPALSKPILHTRYRMVETGRTSSSDPNLQNMRRLIGVRECIKPRDGFVLLASDYGGLELCTLAEVCYAILGRSTLGDLLNSGMDPHLMVASQILNRPYETLDKSHEDVDNARQTGKVANFGFPGGLGAAALVAFAEDSYGVILTEDEARDLKRIWLRTLPEMKDYFVLIDRTVKTDGGIWQLYSNRFRGGCGYTDGCNTYFQGLGADIARSAGWDIMKACYVDTSSVLFGSRVVLFVHDEYVLEVPELLVHECGQELPRLMIQAAKRWLKHVNIKCETAAMRRYSKKAKPKFVNGRLVPVENSRWYDAASH